MKRPAIAKAALGMTVSDDDIPEDESFRRHSETDEVIVWVSGTENDDEWEAANVMSRCPRCPTNKIAQMLAIPISEDQYTIIRGRPVDTSMGDDPYGEEVYLGES